jgi:hypothetical protein
MLVACLAALAACASNPVSQVREVAPGIYSLTHAAKADDEAVRRAGEYCHAKGQKLQIVYSGESYELQFRCVAAE